jgi:hypothetical protein
MTNINPSADERLIDPVTVFDYLGQDSERETILGRYKALMQDLAEAGVEVGRQFSREERNSR